MEQKSPNGNKPPDNIPFSRTPVECRSCGKAFHRDFIFEAIDGLEQVRIGSGLFEITKVRCLHCGEIFNWNPSEKTLRELATEYHEILILLKGNYNPE